MSKKTVIGLVCGGQGAEHAVDLVFLAEIVSGFDPDRYTVIVLAIDRAGNWHFGKKPGDCIQYADRLDRVKLIKSAPVVDLFPGGKIRNRATGGCLATVNVFFPITDDPIQDILEAAGAPYVGSPSEGSALCRDKDASKRVIREAGFMVAPHAVVTRETPLSFTEAAKRFGVPMFIKPNSLGSSIGISKVSDEPGYDQGLVEAFRYDRKVLVEKTMAGREIECAVLGNENPEAALVLGEVTNFKDFYDFNAKYGKGEENKIIIPAPLGRDVVERIRDGAIAVYRLLKCAGYARIDTFLFPDNSFAIIEVNASPGLAGHLMYPRLWGASGVPHRRLLDRLVLLAQDRYQSCPNHTKLKP